MIFLVEIGSGELRCALAQSPEAKTMIQFANPGPSRSCRRQIISINVAQQHVGQQRRPDLHSITMTFVTSQAINIFMLRFSAVAQKRTTTAKACQKRMRLTSRANGKISPLPGSGLARVLPTQLGLILFLKYKTRMGKKKCNSHKLSVGHDIYRGLRAGLRIRPAIFRKK